MSQRSGVPKACLRTVGLPGRAWRILETVTWSLCYVCALRVSLESVSPFLWVDEQTVARRAEHRSRSAVHAKPHATSYS